jgi:hypothetical protein
MVEPNIKLLSAMRENGLRQRGFAKRVGDHESFVSRVVNGWVNLDKDRKKKYAKILKKKVEDIFSD